LNGEKKRKIMKKNKKNTILILCLAAMLVLALALGACDDETAGGTGRTDASGGGGDVLAVVEGTDITQKQLDDMCDVIALTYYYTTVGGIEAQYGEEEMTYFNNSVLIEVVNNQIVRNAVKEFDEAAEENAKAYADEQYDLMAAQSPDSVAMITGAGIEIETFKEAYLQTSYYYNAYGDHVIEEDPVTAEEVQTYYDENKSEYVSPASIELSHILVGDSNLTDDDRTTAEAIRKRALDGEDFAELAKEYSLDTGSAENGGSLGLVTTGEMVEAFETAGFALKKGEISDVVESEYGFHIIKADSDVTPEQQQSLEDAMSAIQSTLEQERYQAALTALLESKEGDVEYNTDKVDIDSSTGQPRISAPATTDEAVTTEDGATDGSTADDGSAADDSAADDGASSE
jgi:foldase protein PrsA